MSLHVATDRDGVHLVVAPPDEPEPFQMGYVARTMTVIEAQKLRDDLIRVLPDHPCAAKGDVPPLRHEETGHGSRGW